ncbi:MAG: TlyA family RNA methyltransferase [Pleurocapsa minor GSE-CHR-MK-17-07R]|jgi:23S rRNA (cytidine1920-2'-O)/16S rRNA (cytidine1409-2'-O)-methyltransferase|nr:TlyA family RNA methyltransferase [Pleurocapsa minor GSE-CHR-MK 17-07R]
MKEKIRLDILLHERGLAPSREKARAYIMAGEVNVDGRMVDKPGTRVADTADVVLKARAKFVSRGGDKLDAALDAFPVTVIDAICADVGASTGGFTDCLLQRGAGRVYAIDVGYGQLAYNIRQDPRVVVIERTNARHIEHLDEQPSLVVIDASFISLTLILPAVLKWVPAAFDIVALIKPQFEAGREDVGKGGVVRDTGTHARVIHDVGAFAQQRGLHIRGLIRSPLKGPAGNIEFLIWLSSDAPTIPYDIMQAIETIV